jgi:glycine/D-amino acid oxidase-like deaminating enzyme
VHATVIGAGIFGVTAVIELADRGIDVVLVDRGPVPHPLAESTDISKVVRIDYGADELYTTLGERALAGWARWNARWPRPLFHDTGVTYLARTPMAPGGFEHDSYEHLVRRGHALERLDADAIAARWPAYRRGYLVDGYYNPLGGWAESGAVVAQLVDDARARGVRIELRDLDALPDDDLVVVCTGAWARRLVPDLPLVATGQPVFHLAPDEPHLFEAVRFPVWGADIARTGYYGFPLHAGVVKIANHGIGITIDPEAPREVSAEQEANLRAFLADAFPRLATARIVHRRLCVYGDTDDGDLWIARHPARENLVVATGGSGHAFKFAPVLGGLIADACAGIERPRFAWRTRAATPGDAARHR